nr:Coproporphyrinogen III oxidase, aerobic [Rhizobiaceae bacterium]
MPRPRLPNGAKFWTVAKMRFGGLPASGKHHGTTRPAEGPARGHRREEECRPRLVRAAARRDLRQLRGDRGRPAGAALRHAARPLRRQGLAARGGRRRRRTHVDDGRPRLREGRRAHVHRPRRILAGVPRPDPRRQRGPALLGLRHLAHRPSGEPQRARRAHEHAHGRDHQPLVRRRGGPDAGARPPPRDGRPRHHALPQGDGDRLQPPSRRRPPEIQGMVRRLFLPQAPGRTARHRRHLLRLAAFAGGTRRLGRRLRLHAGCRPGLRHGLSEDRARELQQGLDGRGPRRAARAARPLCRVQPALRPRHHLRPQDRRQCRIDPLLAAPGGALALKAGPRRLVITDPHCPWYDAACMSPWRKQS